jgi:HEAT repeat protein
MSRFSSDVVPLLRERLRPAVAAPADVTRPLLTDLDSNSFERREQASKHLRELGYQAGPALRKALEGNPSLEQRRRIEELLAALMSAFPPLSADEKRGLRAVVILERIGTPEARLLLELLAKGPIDARLTQEAKASLERLVRQSGTKP